MIRTPQETHLVGVLHSNRHLLTLRTCGVHAGGNHSPRTHILSARNHVVASVLICPRSAMIQPAANCVRVAPLGSRAEAQHCALVRSGGAARRKGMLVEWWRRPPPFLHGDSGLAGSPCGKPRSLDKRKCTDTKTRPLESRAAVLRLDANRLPC